MSLTVYDYYDAQLLLVISLFVFMECTTNFRLVFFMRNWLLITVRRTLTVVRLLYSCSPIL